MIQVFLFISTNAKSHIQIDSVCVCVSSIYYIPIYKLRTHLCVCMCVGVCGCMCVYVSFYMSVYMRMCENIFSQKY